MKKVSVCKGLRGFVSNRRNHTGASPKRKARGSNPPAGAISSTKSSENPKILCFFYNFLKTEGKRYISHLKGGRFILYYLLITVTTKLKSNYIPFSP